jgi:hypothetical protein
MSSSPPLHGGGSAATWYLITAGRPNVLYVYDPALGVRGAYWDPAGVTDFAALALSGGLHDWLGAAANARRRDGLRFYLTSFGTVGACR